MGKSKRSDRHRGFSFPHLGSHLVVRVFSYLIGHFLGQIPSPNIRTNLPSGPIRCRRHRQPRSPQAFFERILWSQVIPRHALLAKYYSAGSGESIQRRSPVRVKSRRRPTYARCLVLGVEQTYPSKNRHRSHECLSLRAADTSESSFAANSVLRFFFENSKITLRPSRG